MSAQILTQPAGERPAQSRTRHRLSQVLLLLIGVAAWVLLPEILLAPIIPVVAFSDHPFLYGSILLLLCAVCFLCVVGARRESRPVVNFISRVFLLPFTVSAGLLALEAFVGGGVGTAVTFEEHGVSLEYSLPLVYGLLLVLLVAAGIKISFALRIRYWIILLVTLVAALVGAPLLFLRAIFG